MDIFRNTKLIKTTQRIKRRYRPGGRKKVNMYYKTDAAENYEVYWLPTPTSALETGHKVQLKELVSRAKAERISDTLNRETKGALGVYVFRKKKRKI